METQENLTPSCTSHCLPWAQPFWISYLANPANKILRKTRFTCTYKVFMAESAAGIKACATDYDRSLIGCTEPIIDHENPSRFLSLLTCMSYDIAHHFVLCHIVGPQTVVPVTAAEHQLCIMGYREEIGRNLEAGCEGSC